MVVEIRLGMSSRRNSVAAAGALALTSLSLTSQPAWNARTARAGAGVSDVTSAGDGYRDRRY